MIIHKDTFIHKCIKCGKPHDAREGWTSVQCQGEYWGEDKDGRSLYTLWDEYYCPECMLKFRDM